MLPKEIECRYCGRKNDASSVECEKCGAKYFHNSFTNAKKKMEFGCRFCGGKMIESKITPKEFGQIYLKDNTLDNNEVQNEKENN